MAWTGAVPTNTNWNNDLNWRRASKEELFKTAGQNTDGYKDYGTDEPGVQQFPNSEKPDETPQAFVPMKFTKVVINPGTSAPYLGNYIVDQRMGIISNLLNPAFSEGTKDIAYDLMVKMEKNAEGCYECEPFYANTCKEVFFRTDRTDLPSGEGQMRNQHYLAYKRAWVDYAMTPNKWNLLAAPLHGVFAGDLYLPAKRDDRKRRLSSLSPSTLQRATAARGIRSISVTGTRRLAGSSRKTAMTTVPMCLSMLSATRWCSRNGAMSTMT